MKSHTTNSFGSTETGHILVYRNARRSPLCGNAILATIIAAQVFWTFNDSTIECGRLIVDGGAFAWCQIIRSVVRVRRVWYIVLFTFQMALRWVIFREVWTIESALYSWRKKLIVVIRSVTDMQNYGEEHSTNLVAQQASPSLISLQPSSS